MPLWLQQYMGYTATWAGIVTAPTGVLAVLLTPLVARLMPRADPPARELRVRGVPAVVAFMRSGFTTGADAVTLAMPQLVMRAAMSTLLRAADRDAALRPAAGTHPDRLGPVELRAHHRRRDRGPRLYTTQWEDRAALHHAQLVEHLTPLLADHDADAEHLRPAVRPRPAAGPRRPRSPGHAAVGAARRR